MRRIYSSILVLFVVSASAHAADAVKINRPAPVVVHKFFDRKSPPSDMPPLEGEEAAVTKSVFGIESEFSVQVMPEEKRNKTVNKIKIAGVTANLSLKITIWVPDDKPKVIVEHEEGHRQISEYFYKDADKLARAIAEKYVGQTYEAEGEDAEAASRKVLDKVLTELSQKYMGQTQVISVRANEIFDEVTNHGRNQKISVEAGVKQSIERAKKEKK